MNPRLASFLSWLVTLLTPVALILVVARLVLTPLFPQIEYRMPGFPPDDYGFTTQDRIKWSGYAWHYVLSSEKTSYLGDLRFADGSPVFNERELSHMDDVQRVAHGAFSVLGVVLAVLIGLGIYARYGGWLKSYFRGLRRGGWAMVWIIAVLGLFMLVSFWNFFTVFHEVFFQGNSWLFEFSDTLIRLFPLRFWQDVFLSVMGLMLLAGLLLGLLVKPNRFSGV